MYQILTSAYHNDFPSINENGTFIVGNEKKKKNNKQTSSVFFYMVAQWRQISLRIRTAWSVFTVRVKKLRLESLAPIERQAILGGEWSEAAQASAWA